MFAHIKYEAAEVPGRLKTSLLESTLGAQREVANFVAMMSNRLASVREGSSVKHAAFVLGISAAAAGTAQSTSAGPSSKKGPQ